MVWVGAFFSKEKPPTSGTSRGYPVFSVVFENTREEISPGDLPRKTREQSGTLIKKLQYIRISTTVTCALGRIRGVHESLPEYPVETPLMGEACCYSPRQRMRRTVSIQERRLHEVRQLSGKSGATRTRSRTAHVLRRRMSGARSRLGLSCRSFRSPRREREREFVPGSVRERDLSRPESR